MIQKLDEQYLNWLYRLVERPPNPFDEVDEGYWRLMWSLYTIPFDVVVYQDRNRAMDATGFRETFLESPDIPDDLAPSEWLDMDPSLLEVIVSLANRMQFLTNIDIAECFWELMTNAGFDRYDDGAFEGSDVEMIASTIIFRWYERDGKGGLFPLTTADEDQRKVELLYQMYDYISENML